MILLADGNRDMWRWLLISVLLTITVLAAAMAPTPAQVRVGSSGHALDANLQLGSGGYNSRSGSQRQFMNRPTYSVSRSGATIRRHDMGFGANRRYGVGRTGPYTARAGAHAYTRAVHRKPPPRRAGTGGNRLDANLQLGRGGYNAAKSSGRLFVSNQTYTVSPAGGNRYNRPSGLGTQQRYSVGRSVPYYKKPPSPQKANVNPYSWSEIWR